MGPTTDPGPSTLDDNTDYSDDYTERTCMTSSSSEDECPEQTDPSMFVFELKKRPDNHLAPVDAVQDKRRQGKLGRSFRKARKRVESLGTDYNVSPRAQRKISMAGRRIKHIVQPMVQQRRKTLAREEEEQNKETSNGKWLEDLLKVAVEVGEVAEQDVCDTFYPA